MLKKLTDLGAEQERRAFAGLSPQELATLDGLLDRINENLTRSAQEIAPRGAAANLPLPAA